MINTPVGTIVLIVATFLFGLYEIGYGCYAYRLNGFKFYINAGFLIGTPFLAAASILLLLPDRTYHGWEILILLVWLFGVGWKAWRKQVAKQEHPLEWAKWEAILKGK